MLTNRLILTLYLSVVCATVGDENTFASTLYHQDPSDLWNRMHTALMVRMAPDGSHRGDEEIDPLLWLGTRQFLSPARIAALREALDEFNAQDKECLKACSAIQRALMQRELCAIFDWTAKVSLKEPAIDEILRDAITELQPRLVRAIRLIALPVSEIAGLPDAYSQTVAVGAYGEKWSAAEIYKAYLPSSIMDPDGPWICLSAGWLPAPVHFREFGGRSAFLMYMRTPDGEAATLQYLRMLNQFQKPWRETNPDEPFDSALMPHGGPGFGLSANPDTPQFPEGTQFALVRQAILIDDSGEAVVSPIVESIQLRTYIDMRRNQNQPWSQQSQAFAEFEISLRALLNGSPALRAVKVTDERFNRFLTRHHWDRLEGTPEKWSQWTRYQSNRRKELNCRSCHDGWGIHSVISRSQLFDPRHVRPLTFKQHAPKVVNSRYLQEKNKRFDWGLFTGLWRALP